MPPCPGSPVFEKGGSDPQVFQQRRVEHREVVAVAGPGFSSEQLAGILHGVEDRAVLGDAGERRLGVGLVADPVGAHGVEQHRGHADVRVGELAGQQSAVALDQAPGNRGDGNVRRGDEGGRHTFDVPAQLSLAGEVDALEPFLDQVVPVVAGVAHPHCRGDVVVEIGFRQVEQLLVEFGFEAVFLRALRRQLDLLGVRRCHGLGEHQRDDDGYRLGGGVGEHDLEEVGLPVVLVQRAKDRSRPDGRRLDADLVRVVLQTHGDVMRGAEDGGILVRVIELHVAVLEAEPRVDRGRLPAAFRGFDLGLQAGSQGQLRADPVLGADSKVVVEVSRQRHYSQRGFVGQAPGAGGWA